jgi:hypothetical protein
MKIYFYDENNRYIGSRELTEGEEIPANATTETANVGPRQEAYLVNGKWEVRQLPPDPVITGA